MRLFCFNALILCLGISSVHADQLSPAVELKVGGTTRLSVSSSRVETVRVISGSAEAIELTIEQDDPELQLSVIGADHKVLRTAGPTAAHKYLLSFPTKITGTLVLRIQSRGSNSDNEDSFISIEARAVRTSDLPLRTEAEDAYLKAQELRSTATSEALQREIELVRSAGEKWQGLRDLRGRVLALESQGEALLAGSQYEPALRAYHRAEQLLVGDAPELTSVINGESRVYLEWWKSTPAMKLAERALKLSLAHRDIGGEAQARANKAEALYLITEDDAASKDLDSALDVIGTSHKLLRARIFRCKAWIEEDRGHLTRAGALMEKSDELFRQTGEVRESLNRLSDMATLTGMQGDHYTSMLRHSKLAKLLQKSGDVAGAAFSLENLGTDYSALNRNEDAVRYYLSAEHLFASLDHASGRLTSLGHLCVTEIQLNRLIAASRDCSSSRTLAHEIGDPKREAIAEWRMAKAQLAAGKLQGALEGFRRAADLSEEVKDSRFQALSLLDLGTAVEKLGNSNAAYEFYRQAERLSQEAEDPGGQLEALFRLAKIEDALGRRAEATEVLRSTLRRIEAQRTGIADDRLRSSYFASAKKCYDFFIEILMDESRKNPSRGWDRAALEISEASHARSLLDASISSREENPKVLPAEVVKIHADVERLYDQRLRLVLEGNDASLRENAHNLARALDEYDAANDLLSSSEHQRALGEPLKVAALLEKTMQSGHVFIEYALEDKESFAWTVDHGQIEGHLLPAKGKIAKDVRRWKSLIQSRARRPGESFGAFRQRVLGADREVAAASALLSCDLFGTFLKDGAADLVIVPDELLHDVSFSALPQRGCDKSKGPLLIERHTITYTPSLSIYLADSGSPAIRHKGELAVIADPVFDPADRRVKSARAAESLPARTNVMPQPVLSRLPGTREEALSIAALFTPSQVSLKLGFAASLSMVLRGDIAGYGIWHFATHGIADPASPDFSGLVLSLVDARGTPMYGYLHARDISRLRIDADMVVLSSCSSGLGPIAEGEAEGGLTYAFLRSGVRRVVSTSWSVDDDASRELMLSFYKHLALDHQKPEKALQQAQLTLLHEARFANPYYWAGYAMTASQP